MRGGAGGRAAGGAAAHAAAVAVAPRPLLVLAALALAAAAPPAYAQAAAGGEGEGPSESDLVIIFAASIAAVAGIALYVSREAIARKRTDYDRGAYDSQRDRDYEKYHSGWGDESAAGRGAEIGEDGNDGEDGSDGDDGEDEFRPGRPAAGARGPDYYEVLGLERTAAAGEVKRRYRELAKRVHPDRAGEEDGDGAGRRMALINEAYGVLSDPGRRKRYDLWLGRGGGGGGSRRG